MDSYEEYLAGYSNSWADPMTRERWEEVNHPKHYTSHPSGIECIQITRWMNFNLGNAMKYIWRAGEKGDGGTDLEKAIWYLKDEIKRLKEKSK
jgi:hypothetical protein